MRTSSQLRKTNNCEFNPNSALTSVSGVVRDAGVQKKIIKRILMGEPISNIALELEKQYGKENKVWESSLQIAQIVGLQAARIKRFTDWENSAPDRQNKKFLADLKEEYGPLVVNINGEDIEARPDYIIEKDDEVIVCKVKTGRFSDVLENSVKTQEALALGLAGEKIANGREVTLQYLYLGDATEQTERMSLNPAFGIEYDSEEKKYRHIIDAPFTERLKEEIAVLHENEREEGCTKADCEVCAMNNICNYKEPPLAMPEEEIAGRVGGVNPSHDQEAVIDFDRGVARVNAGPGAGKTFVTSHHFERLIEKGYDPKKFCLLTFTKAGAGEMTGRTMKVAAEKGYPLDPDNLTSTTFNAFCQMIINEYYERLGFTKKPRVVDDSTKRGIINRIFDQFPKISSWKYTNSVQPEKVRKDASTIAFIRASQEFEEIKKEGYTRTSYPSAWSRWYTASDINVLFMMYDEYNRQLKAKNLLEFDDHIKYIEQLYEQDNTIFEQLGYEHIVVDEFQDTDLPQIKLLQKMVDTTCFKSLMCVGDDCQSIFAFRHTSPEYMINFGDYFGRNFKDFSLVEIHRFPQNFADYANKISDQLMKNKVEKELVSTKQGGGVMNSNGFYTEKQEYEWIAQDIKRKWDAGERSIAVLMSDRNQLTALADVLTKHGVYSVLKSPTPRISNSRVSALVSFYDAFIGVSDQGFADYQNILAKGGLKGKSAAEIESIAEEFKGQVAANEKTKDVFIAFAKALDLEESDEAYQDFLERFEECNDMEEIKDAMENFKLYGKSETFTPKKSYGGVNLSTIHSAKGLEWDHVYVCVDKLDDTKYHERLRHYQDTGEYDERARLLYVGATRARKDLNVVGKYLLKLDNKQQYAVFNDFLKYSYDFMGRVWGYSYAEYEVVKAQEVAEANAQKVRSTLGNTKIDCVSGKLESDDKEEDSGIEIA